MPRIRIAAVLAVAAALVAPAVAPAAPTTPDQTMLMVTQQRVMALDSTIRSLTSTIRVNDEQIAALNAQIAAFRGISGLEGEIAWRQAQINVLTDTNRQLMFQVQALMKQRTEACVLMSNVMAKLAAGQATTAANLKP